MDMRTEVTNDKLVIYLLFTVTNIENIFNMVGLGNITNVFEYIRVNRTQYWQLCLYSYSFSFLMS